MNDIQLFDRFRAGDEQAGAEIIEKYRGLVLYCVNRTIQKSSIFINLHKDQKQTLFKDLKQAGTEGLIEARNRFESNRGNKFITYAYPWVRKYVLKEINGETRFYKLHQLVSQDDTEGEADEISASLDEFGCNDNRVDDVMFWSDLEKILTPIELDICRLRCQGQTMAEIGRLHGVSAQRIHQLHKRARMKIRQELV